MGDLRPAHSQVLSRSVYRMAVSFTLQPGEFLLNGGHLKKTIIGTGLTIVGKKKMVLLKKGEHWLSWFATGTGVQQNPSKDCSVFATIHRKLRGAI